MSAAATELRKNRVNWDQIDFSLYILPQTDEN